jgi:hypothetical protein
MFPLTPEDESLMVLTGFAVRASDGILTLTDDGNAWVGEWCRKQIEAAT